jgi:predicted RNA-binding Zn ribbon-like protein
MDLAVTADPDAGRPADEPLFLAFVNSLHWDDGAPLEELSDERALAAWSRAHALPAESLEGHLAGFVSLRAHLRSIVERLSRGQTLRQRELTVLQEALSRPCSHFVLVVDAAPSPHLAFELEADSAAAIAFLIALSLARFLESGDRRRLKLCANPGCGFAFLDTSTNNSRRWCDMRACGNRHKVHAFRGRTRSRAARSRGNADVMRPSAPFPAATPPS